MHIELELIDRIFLTKVGKSSPTKALNPSPTLIPVVSNEKHFKYNFKIKIVSV